MSGIRRATYVAEESASRTEKAAARQDAFINGLHAHLRAAHASRDLANARAAEQRTETRAARELLAATVAEVEAVHWERRARGGQWRDSLLAVQRRDEALKVRLCSRNPAVVRVHTVMLGVSCRWHWRRKRRHTHSAPLLFCNPEVCSTTGSHAAFQPAKSWRYAVCGHTLNLVAQSHCAAGGGGAGSGRRAAAQSGGGDSRISARCCRRLGAPRGRVCGAAAAGGRGRNGQFVLARAARQASWPAGAQADVDVVVWIWV